MRHFPFASLFLFIIFSCQSQSEDAVPEWHHEALNAEETAAISRYTQSFPEETELAIALLNVDSVRYVGVKKSGATLQTVENQTYLFEIGSITKVFTAGLLAQLVDEGAVQPDDPIQQYLPVSLHQPEQDGVAPTLLHLANHTSGLPRLPSNMDLSNVANPYKSYDQEKLYQYLAQEQILESVPGKINVYSNLGFGLLGRILTLQTNQSYEALIRERIAKPLGMDRTWVTVPSLQHQLVPGRDAQGNVTSNWDFNALVGVGDIKSTVEDMTAWLRANMQEAAPQHAIWQQCQQPTFAVDERLSLGLGWHISPGAQGPVYWHNGGTGGYRSCVALDAENEVGVIVLSNLSAFSSSEANIDQLCFNLLMGK